MTASIHISSVPFVELQKNLGYTHHNLIALAIREKLTPIPMSDDYIVEMRELFFQPLLRKKINEIADKNGISFGDTFVGLTLAGIKLINYKREQDRFSEKITPDLPQVKIKEKKEINVLFPELGKLFDNQKTAIDNILNGSWKRDLSSINGSGRELVLEEIASKLEKQILKFKKGHIKLTECRKSSEKLFRVAIEITHCEHSDYRDKIRFYLPISQLVKIGKDKYCPQWIFEKAKKKEGRDGKTAWGEYYPTLTEPVWIGKQEWIDAHV